MVLYLPDMHEYSASATISINASSSKVWEALIDPVQVKKYFFNTELQTTWEVGTPIYFKGEWEGKEYQDKGTVHEYLPLQKISYDYWSPFSGLVDTPENYQLITYSITSEETGVLLTVSQSNLDSHDRVTTSVNNWNMVLNSLKVLVEEVQ